MIFYHTNDNIVNVIIIGRSQFTSVNIEKLNLSFKTKRNKEKYTTALERLLMTYRNMNSKVKN